MNKVKLLSILVGLLVILNVIVLSFFLLVKKGKDHNPDGPNHEGPVRHIIERFGFDDAQVDLFNASRAKHMEQTRGLTKELEEASLAYYKQSTSDESKDSLYAPVASITKRIYEANDIHFDEVRKLCTVDQLPKMEGFINGLLSRKGRKGKPRGRGRH